MANVVQSLVVSGPNFAQVPVSQVLVQPTGNASAYALGDVLAGLAPTYKVVTGITATPSGTQGTSILLSGSVNVVATVATIGDGVKLPLAVQGIAVMIANTAANACQVFGSGTDTINAAATAVGVSQGGVSSAIYYCVSSAPAGNWRRVLSA